MNESFFNALTTEEQDEYIAELQADWKQDAREEVIDSYVFY